jgi:hypothetical protein
MITELAIIFASVSQTYKLPDDLLSAVCWHESSHKVETFVKHDGKKKGNKKSTPSYGICQLKLATARAMGYTGKAANLMDPSTNIDIAGKYLAFQIDRYHKDYAKAVTAYNQGTTYGTGGSPYLAFIFNAWVNKPWEKINREYATQHE